MSQKIAFLVMLATAVAAGAQDMPVSSGDHNQPPQAMSGQTQAGEQGTGANESLSPEAEDRIMREVRHELLMLPYYNVFDNLAFKVDGRTVTLLGQVTNSSLKPDAERAVKKIEGVEKVINNIEVLPPSPGDDRIRRAVYRSIYSYGPLFKYGNMSVPPIHIIVKNGNVDLEGVVDGEGDKNAAGIRAKLVPGTFQVTNNLRVVNSKKK